MSDHELRRARATLLSFKTPSHRGASLVAKCVLHGDPVANAAVAPAVQWAATIWQTAVAQERSLFTMPQLADMFRQVHDKWDPEMPWRKTKGPIVRMLMCLQRVSWEPKNFSEWIDDRG
eukprot:4559628-Pyramimonas_sp.AAC.1